jgi:tetratricopeptide (TPR) repeat protein
VALYFWLSSGKPPGSPPLPDLAQLNEYPDESTIPANPGYVGPAACAPCHAARVTEFLKTPHARACRRPQDGPMPPGFEPGRAQYLTGDADLRFVMTREGSDFFQTALQRDSGAVRQVKSRIDLVYGVNKADEVFFSWRDDRLFELMTVWLHPSNEWANTSYNRHGTGDFARDTTSRCLECHNTWFAHVPGTVNQYVPDSFVLGVTCEKCHGPGKAHVEFHQANPDTRDPHAIVQPGRLERERAIEVCTQCHGNWTKPRGPANSYRPGEPLENYYRLAQTKYPEQDHVANQIKYLRQSKCFQKSDSMTCVTCHDPHRPHDRTNAASSQRACAQCHKQEACTDRPNLPVAIRDDCVACHMRPNFWMNVHFHTTTDRYVPPVRRFDHKIGINRLARSEVLMEWHRRQDGESHRREADRLTRELAEHWLMEAAERRSNYRFLASIGAAREALRLDLPATIRDRAVAALRGAIALETQIDADLTSALHAADEQRFDTAIDVLNRILQTKPDWAVVQSKLGTLYAATGRTDQARSHLQAVSRDDQDDGSGLAMLGWLAYLDGRTEDAIGFYRRADEIEPFNAKINFHMGLAYAQAQRWADAADALTRVLTIDPKHAQACEGLAIALRRQGKPAEAVRYAWRRAQLGEFSEPNALVVLADSYAEAGRNREAAAAAAKAIELESASGQPLTFDIRQRMLSLRGLAEEHSR